MKYGIVSEVRIVLNQHAILSIYISKRMITGGMDHIPSYAGIPIVDQLQTVLKGPVSIENDVNCAGVIGAIYHFLHPYE